MLYKRDFSTLSDEEKQKKTIALEYYEKHRDKTNGVIDAEHLFKYHELIPNSCYFNDSLFPNNYLHTTSLYTLTRIEALLSGFCLLLNQNDTNERTILNYINNKECYVLMESLFFYYDFGHHGAYLFKEFPLGTNYVADYLLIGKNSGGYEFVFIELEDPSKHITLKNGDFGSGIRKGISQTEDWKRWIESNFISLRNVFEKYLNSQMQLPSEFINLDMTRIHFMVIAGRREHYNERTYSKRRSLKPNIKIIHYDNMVDETKDFINRNKRHFQSNDK